MYAVNPILNRIARNLLEAMVANINEDAVALDAALEQAHTNASDLVDALVGASAMGTIIGDQSMFLFTEIE